MRLHWVSYLFVTWGLHAVKLDWVSYLFVSYVLQFPLVRSYLISFVVQAFEGQSGYEEIASWADGACACNVSCTCLIMLLGYGPMQCLCCLCPNGIGTRVAFVLLLTFLWKAKNVLKKLSALRKNIPAWFCMTGLWMFNFSLTHPSTWHFKYPVKVLHGRVRVTSDGD